MGPDGSFFCSEIRAEGLPVGEGIPSEEDLFAALNCQKGGWWAALSCEDSPLHPVGGLFGRAASEGWVTVQAGGRLPALLEGE